MLTDTEWLVAAERRESDRCDHPESTGSVPSPYCPHYDSPAGTELAGGGQIVLSAFGLQPVRWAARVPCASQRDMRARVDRYAYSRMARRAEKLAGLCVSSIPSVGSGSISTTSAHPSEVMRLYDSCMSRCTPIRIDWLRIQSMPLSRKLG